MKKIDTLTHITDVGSPIGNGTDSTERIIKQYQRLGIPNPRVISAGHSPLHVAFTACTDVSPGTRNTTKNLLYKLHAKVPNPLPIALNSAPRNSGSEFSDSRGDNLYRVNCPSKPDLETLLIYGDEVLRWVLFFRGLVESRIEQVDSINGITNHPSTGSQFRSAEYLPIAHFLEAIKQLDQYAAIYDISEQLRSRFFPNFPELRNGEAVVAPPDEYGNGRLIIKSEQIKEISGRERVKIKEITDEFLDVKKSLTEVVPGKLSVWPSSNHFPSKDIGVLNIGTRWAPGKTKITDRKAIALAKKLSRNVGAKYRIKA